MTLRFSTRSRSFILVTALAALAIACGDDASSPAGPRDSATSSAGEASPGGSSNDAGPSDGGVPTGSGIVENDFVAGGDRPVNVRVPDHYDPGVPLPLLILLHYYSAIGTREDNYFHMSAVANDRELIFAAPDGLEDVGGNQFWNATPACCNYGQIPVDDSAYLIGLVDEIANHVNVDPGRIYVVGHSNGGFMSYRMACDHAGRIAAIVSFAGAMFDDVTDCAASEPVSTLQIHGTLDNVISYNGGINSASGQPYPGALDSVADWSAFNGCDPTTTSGAPRDIDGAIVGHETTVTTSTGCDAGTTAELWTIVGGAHVPPTLAPDFSEQVIDWLLLRSK